MTGRLRRTMPFCGAASGRVKGAAWFTCLPLESGAPVAVLDIENKRNIGGIFPAFYGRDTVAFCDKRSR